MPRISTFKTNFTAGELSPRLLARVDVAKYPNGVKEMLNAYPLVHGGARRRAGLRWRAEAKHMDKAGRLVPFVFNRKQAFMLELSEGYVRFFTPAGQVESGGSPYEIASPWVEADFPDLKYVQRADTMFFAHPSYPMRKLVRYGNTNWKLSTVVFDVPPSDEIGERPNTTLTPAATTGTGVNFTAGAAAFRASDVGRPIEAGSGRGVIAGFTSTTVVTVDITDAFASTSAIAANSWKIGESPKTTLTPSAVGPVGQTINLTAGASAWKDHAAIPHVGSYVSVNDGLVEITGYSSDTVVSGIVRTVLVSTTAAPSEGWALQQVAWNAVDGYPRAVGLYQQRLLAGGTDAYPTTVWGSKTAEYLNFATGTADSDGFAWALASDQLDAIEHLPATKRVMPLTQGSEWTMFGGVEKPLSPTNVKADQENPNGAANVRPVRVGGEIVFVDTSGRIVRAMGYRVENDSYNSPDVSVLSEHITTDPDDADSLGIMDMAYQQRPDKLVWMVRDDGYLVSMSIDRDQDAIGFARHSTQGQFESVAVMPSETGRLDQLWAIVVREVAGATVRYVETFEEGLQTDCAAKGAVPENAIANASWSAGVLTLTRAGHGLSTGDTVRLSGFTAANDDITGGVNDEYTITVTGANTYTVPFAQNPGAISVLGTDAIPVTDWSDLDHLEGLEATIVADGYVATPQTVLLGAITLDKAAYEVEIGLGYTSRIVTLPIEVGTGQGTSQGNAVSVHEVVARFYKTKGGTVNGQYLMTRAFGSGAVLNQPVPEFTGDKRIEKLGWGRNGSGDFDGTLTFEQPQPLAWQLLGVVARMTANDG